MKGTAKQIAWAQDIIENGLNTIKANIELDEKKYAETGHPMYQTSARLWRVELIAATTKAANVEDAEQVINRQHGYDGGCWVSVHDKYMRMINSGKVTIDQIEGSVK